ncbi:MAG TPA: hypothetical protein VHE33_07455 [Acidobacteriaceae bacterium]|nr:hypothetical protein [Acidobacteriaceae bacterium]
MKFRKDAAANPELDSSRDDIRDLAEDLSLYRSAMHHLAESEAARRPFVAEARPAHSFHLRLLLAPALAAAVAAGVFVPVYSHFHHRHPAVATASQAAPDPTEARASIDDSALMNQIDSDLSENVPDALQPLADLSDQATTKNSVSENKNATHE